jgi:hypothetical protein
MVSEGFSALSATACFGVNGKCSTSGVEFLTGAAATGVGAGTGAGAGVATGAEPEFEISDLRFETAAGAGAMTTGAAMGAGSGAGTAAGVSGANGLRYSLWTLMISIVVGL